MIDYLADLESDFSRFHRVDDIYQLDGPRFLRMAWRVSTYGGVMAMRLQAQRDADAAPAAAPAGGGSVELAAFMVSYPGLVERVEASD